VREESFVTSKIRKPNHSGSTFDSPLQEDGILEDVEAVALNRVIAYALAETMNAKKISKRAMAAQLMTSRHQLDRLLAGKHTSVTLATLRRAADAVGKNLRVELE
jgi:DNA-binding Xre family transcriptional regulator